jgi:hypothetical protein
MLAIAMFIFAFMAPPAVTGLFVADAFTLNTATRRWNSAIVLIDAEKLTGQTAMPRLRG